MSFSSSTGSLSPNRVLTIDITELFSVLNSGPATDYNTSLQPVFKYTLSVTHTKVSQSFKDAIIKAILRLFFETILVKYKSKQLSSYIVYNLPVTPDVWLTSVANTRMPFYVLYSKNRHIKLPMR